MYVYIYIYTYVDRQRQREKKKERKRERESAVRGLGPEPCNSKLNNGGRRGRGRLIRLRALGLGLKV